VYGFRWERWSALAGVLFVALFMLGIALSNNSGDTTAKLQNYYADSGHRTREFVAFFLIIGAGLVDVSRRGTWAFYRLVPESVAQLSRALAA
jgi:DNA-binding transcriptional ArsR family regulator